MPRNTPAPVSSGYPLLQWANGKTEARAPGGRFGPLVGWHIEQGDPGIDAHCRDLAVPTVEIKHRRQGGFEVKPHWSLGEAVRIVPLTPGPIADKMAGATRQSQRMADEAAMVTHWPQGDRSYLAFLALAELGGALYAEPVQLLTTSTLTDHLFAAVLEHLRVCTLADELVGQEVSPWWLMLPLQAGNELDAGKDETTTITPMRANHAATLDRATLNLIKLPADWREYVDGLLPTAFAWARETLAVREERLTAA